MSLLKHWKMTFFRSRKWVWPAESRGRSRCWWADRASRVLRRTLEEVLVGSQTRNVADHHLTNWLLEPWTVQEEQFDPRSDSGSTVHRSHVHVSFSSRVFRVLMIYSGNMIAIDFLWQNYKRQQMKLFLILDLWFYSPNPHHVIYYLDYISIRRNVTSMYTCFCVSAHLIWSISVHGFILYIWRPQSICKYGAVYFYSCHVLEYCNSVISQVGINESECKLSDLIKHSLAHFLVREVCECVDIHPVTCPDLPAAAAPPLAPRRGLSHPARDERPLESRATGSFSLTWFSTDSSSKYFSLWVTSFTPDG